MTNVIKAKVEILRARMLSEVWDFCNGLRDEIYAVVGEDGYYDLMQQIREDCMICEIDGTKPEWDMPKPLPPFKLSEQAYSIKYRNWAVSYYWHSPEDRPEAEPEMDWHWSEESAQLSANNHKEEYEVKICEYSPDGEFIQSYPYLDWRYPPSKKPVCKHCGSKKIVVEISVGWGNDEIRVSDYLGSSDWHCADCGSMELEWKEFPNTQHPALRIV